MSEHFKIENGTLHRYLGKETEVTIPDNVKRIAPFAFFNCPTVEKVVTPYNLAKIGKGAFYACPSLKEVVIPGRIFKRVKGDKIFDNFNAIYFRFYVGAAQDIPDDVSFENYPIPKGAEYVADLVGRDDTDFAPTDLYYATDAIYDAIPEHADPADEDDEAIVPIADEDEIETLREKIDAITPDEDADPESEKRRRSLIDISDFLIEDTTVIKYIGAKKSVVVPDFITHIGDGAFSNSEVEEVALPEGLVAICKSAFTWCVKMKKIKLPENLTLIDDMAFAECSGLTKIEIPDSVKYIGESAFHACSAMEELKLSSSLTTISRRCFDFCVKLTKITVPDGVISLAEGAFSHCEGVKTVELPEGLKELGNWAFAECYELQNINYPESLEKIGDVAFMNCGELRKLELPKSVTAIGRQAYVGCTGLTIVTLPRHLENRLQSLKVFYRLKNVQVEFED